MIKFQDLKLGDIFMFNPVGIYFVKRGDRLADVIHAHRRHRAAPASGFLDDVDPETLVYHLDPDKFLAQMVREGVIKAADAMLVFVRQFPCLAGFYGPESKWDADALDRSALKFSSGEVAAARFVLNLYNPNVDWIIGRFNFFADVSNMDEKHRQPVIEWLKNPWWP